MDAGESDSEEAPEASDGGMSEVEESDSEWVDADASAAATGCARSAVPLRDATATLQACLDFFCAQQGEHAAALYALAPEVELQWWPATAGGERLPLSISFAWGACDPRCAAFIHAYTEAAASPALLRGFSVFVGGQRVFAISTEQRGSDATISYVDSLPCLLPDSTPPVVASALFRAGMAAAAALAGLEGATRLLVVACAPEWLRDGDCLLRDEFLLLQPALAGMFMHALATGASEAAGLKAALKLQDEATVKLCTRAYPGLLRLLARTGVVGRWARVEPRDAESVPLFPGCLLAKTGLELLSGERRLLPGRALGYAALAALKADKRAVFVAEVAAPPAALAALVASYVAAAANGSGYFAPLPGHVASYAAQAATPARASTSAEACGGGIGRALANSFLAQQRQERAWAAHEVQAPAAMHPY
jgi:hypothetical protein